MCDIIVVVSGKAARQLQYEAACYCVLIENEKRICLIEKYILSIEISFIFETSRLTKF